MSMRFPDKVFPITARYLSAIARGGEMRLTPDIL